MLEFDDKALLQYHRLNILLLPNAKLVILEGEAGHFMTIEQMSLLSSARAITNSLRLDGMPPQLDGDFDWPQLVRHADGHSLTPLLYDTWREAGLLAQLPATIRDRMAQAYADNARRNTFIRQELLEVHQILSEAGVPHLVLKGWPLVEQLYTDPAHRVLYDHDFLVSVERAEIGHQALKAAGFHPLPSKDEWVQKHLQPLWRNDGYQWDGYLFDPYYPRPIELHVRLWEQGWRGLQTGSLVDLWVETQTCLVAGAPMQLLSAENTVVHLAMHFAGHLIEREARLNQLLDLARLVHMHLTTLNWEQVLARAIEVNIGRFAYASLFLAHEIFGAPLPPHAIWQQLNQATPPNFRSWLTNHGPADVLTSDYRRKEKGKDYQLTFLAAHSLGERLGIMRFAALPPVEQLVTKYNLRHRRLGPLYYPRYIAERVGQYSRDLLGRLF
jgi:hypothetical protein